MVSCYFAMIAQREARRGARRTGEAAICIMSVAKTQFKRDWFILTSLVSKDFKLKYRRSVLGVLWSVLNPLLMMIVLSAVFSVVFRGSVDGPFPVYLILGMTLFTFMSDATSGAMGSIIDSAPLIKKIRINKMLFPLEKVLFALLNYAISLIAVALVMLFFQVHLPSTFCLCRFCSLTCSCSAWASGSCFHRCPCSSATSCTSWASF